jgi:thiosulfate reductase cytochrome b subunit
MKTPGNTDAAVARTQTPSVALPASTGAPPPPRSRWVYRHRWPVRLMHWINVICLAVLLGSGLQILNAHPSLSWGQTNDAGTAWLTIGAVPGADGKPAGVTRLFGHTFNTDGVLGASDINGRHIQRGFPSWATIPGPNWLSLGRRWHFFFAWVFVINGACYVLWSVFSRHLARNLTPDANDWRGFGRSVIDHIRFRHPQGEEALRYNVLQKLAYLAVVFGLGGGIVLMGILMSPRMNALVPWLVDLVGGRQSARSIHFLIACGFVAFIAVHLFEVLVNGVVNQVGSMLTGYYRVREKKPND